MSFELHGHLLGADNPVMVHQIIGNSKTIAVGEAVNTSAGYAQRCTVGSLVHGIVMAIVNKDGIDLDNANTDSYDGTWTPSTKTYVSASDNTSDKKVKAIVCSDPFALFKNAADGDLTEAMRFQYHDLVSAAQINADTNTESKGALQFWRLSPDTGDAATQGLFRIGEWAGFPYAQVAE